MQELFKNTHEALTFAYRYSSQQYALSPMAKLMKTGIGSGKGLVSLDGAAQAGIILAHVSRLSPLHQACITARFATRFEECPCCHHKDKMTDEYREAIGKLADWAVSQTTGMSLRNMRAAIVRAYFEKGVSILAAAKELNVPKSTAHDLKARIFKGLKELDGAAQSHVETQLSDVCQQEISCAGKTVPV